MLDWALIAAEADASADATVQELKEVCRANKSHTLGHD